MEILNSIFSWVIKKRIHQIELFKKYPIDVQKEWFHTLINEAQNTEFGQQHQFKSIHSIADFKNRFPVQNYETLKPYINRTLKGEQNILWHSEIKWFAKSSGTENDKSKFIPVSNESLKDCHYNGGKDILSIYCNNVEKPNLFGGKSLMMGGSSGVNHFNNNSHYGDLSAIIMKNLPFWAEFKRIPSLDIALLNKWEEKLEQMAKAAVNENVISLSGIPSWGLVLLRRVLELKGATDISEIWPNLEFYLHGGVSFKPYQQQFKNIISSPKINYMECFNASEGLFGIQDDLTDEGMLLMLDYGIFYEFIPFGEEKSEFPTTLGLDEVQLNTDYAMIISTNSGLWRYNIGDVIQFTSLLPFKIKITGRTKHYINAFGEELMVHNVEKALEITTSKTNSSIADYTIAPVFMQTNNSGAHEWLIEFEKQPENINYFIEILDNSLKFINSDYEAKRYNDYVLRKPIIKLLPKKTFYNWMKKRGKLGGQNKVPRLFNNRKFVDDILNYICEN